MILRVLALAIASLLILVLFICLAKGKKYTAMVENLDHSDYFLKDFYVIGFVMNDTKLFKLRGKLGKELKKNAKLLWNNIYAEYYSNLAWAQFLSLSLLVLSIGFVISGLFSGMASLIVIFISLLFVAAIWNISITKMKEIVVKRREECEYEFPNMVSKLSLLINSGMVLREAWYLVAYGKNGALYDLMKKSCECMDNGDSDIVAINKFGILTDSVEIKKFTSALIQGIEKGNSELADFLMLQVSELWAHKRQIVLQKGEVAAGKLIIPLGLMFGGIIMIIVAAAMQSMSF